MIRRWKGRKRRRRVEELENECGRMCKYGCDVLIWRKMVGCEFVRRGLKEGRKRKLSLLSRIMAMS